jgi:ankyrin repeat protein
MPSSIRKTLNELPTTLDDTYERALQGIPKEKLQHAHHLFLCLIAAIRPLHVEELAEIFAINFDADSGSNLMVDWRPDNPEEAILSTCSTLIVVIENEDKRSKIVQFSHFSVKEFLTSDRLRTSDIENIRIYYIPLDFAHTVLVRACLTVLLQLDGSVDKERLDGFPLASYAAQHWVDHAKFKDVETRIQDDMERLFDPRNTYLASWIWIHDVDNGWTRSIDDLPEHPSQPEGTALYYAVSCGFSGLANYLIHTHAEDVNGMSGYQGTPLHAASYWGQVDAVRLLLDHGADVNTKNEREKTPLFSACDGGHLEVMRLLIEHGSDVDTICPAGTLLKEASERGQVDIVRLLLQHNVNIEDNRGGSNWLGWTPLHRASFGGHPKVAEVLLEHGAKVNALSKSHDTPLFVASDYGKLEVARVLLEHGADVHIRGEHNQTPFQKATSNDHTELAQLLLEFGAQKE